MYKPHFNSSAYKLFGVNFWTYAIIRTLNNNVDISAINSCLADYEYFCTL